MSTPQRAPRPEWLRITIKTDESFRQLRSMVGELRLNTVCQEARCPNIYECWNAGTATFMILGETCTRFCGFCNVRSGRPEPGVDRDEPAHVAQAVARLGLKHAVITSVDRDDLKDGGAGHFAEVIRTIHRDVPGCAVEVLTPDFKRKPGALDTVLDAGPAVFAHNVETVPRLYKVARPGSSYDGSVGLLAAAAARRDREASSLRVKSSIIVGLGEDDEETLAVMRDLKAAGVDVVTLGQYLQPTPRHLPVARWVHPDTVALFRAEGLSMGLLHVEAGPLVRSSYHAERHRPDPPAAGSAGGAGAGAGGGT